MTPRRLPKYVSEFADRHGKIRVRFRRKGQEAYYFTAAPWTPAFMAEYERCLSREAAPAVQPGADRSKAGTMSALIASYYRTAEFTGLERSTQAAYRNAIERFRERHGEKRVAMLERRHVKAIVGGMHATPAAANNLLKRLRTLMRLAVDLGLRPDDPTHGVRGFRTAGDGFHTWTEAEITKFEERHPVGSKARLALALMLCTGQRRSDVVRMGWQHVEGDKIRVRQVKTDAHLILPMHADLLAVLAEAPRGNMTFMVTAYGKPFTPAGFGNWFREQCDAAELPHCSAHGLRKAASRRLAEAGCSHEQIKAVTGHRTDAEVTRYVRAADQSRLAEQAFERMRGADREQPMSNHAGGLDSSVSNVLKMKGK
ncbi:integrase [Constrictibacter sp. MBR-5]|jgi:integrase|uniref:tyrosine-type recombinase/integrase n=1 Tax=Constrictibacter sp. MBR-5 TaxID=3156467 RepID=UPI00339B1939